MQVSDKLSGLLAAAFGIVVVLAARAFPATPGQEIGPGLFPSITGALLVVFGVGLFVGARRKREAGWWALDDWVGRRDARRSVAVVVVALVAWIALVTPVGFIPTTILFVIVLARAMGGRITAALPIAVVVTLVTHYAFSTLLRVRLPWGILQGVAW